jgi:hypothetical protein
MTKSKEEKEKTGDDPLEIGDTLYGVDFDQMPCPFCEGSGTLNRTMFIGSKPQVGTVNCVCNNGTLTGPYRVVSGKVTEITRRITKHGFQDELKTDMSSTIHGGMLFMTHEEAKEHEIALNEAYTRLDVIV